MNKEIAKIILAYEGREMTIPQIKGVIEWLGIETDTEDTEE